MRARDGVCWAALLASAGCGGAGASGPTDGGAWIPPDIAGMFDLVPPPPAYLACLLPGEQPAGPHVGWFTEVTASSGLAQSGAGDPSQTYGNGAAAGDLDGDGLPDLVVTSGLDGDTRVWRNLGGLRFADVTAQLSPMPLARGTVVVLADLDNDGDLDLAIGGDVNHGTVIYENVGGASLVVRTRLQTADPTDITGVPTLGLVPADLDGDGLLDLAAGGGSWVYRNAGGFTFTDVAVAWGFRGPGAPPGFCYGGAWFDPVGDGHLGLYLESDTNAIDYALPSVDAGVHPSHADFFFRPVASPMGPRFGDVAASIGLGTPRSSMGAIVSDFDGDGHLDLYVSSGGRNPVLLGTGDGRFVDDGGRLGIGTVRRLSTDCPPDSLDAKCVYASWGNARFDVDHDGVEDLLVLHGAPGVPQPTSAFRGLRGGGFAPVVTDLGCMTGRTLLPVDLDGDGDLDVVVTTLAGPVRLFRNEAPAARGWLRLQLKGTRSNREGHGALVTATLTDGTTRVRAVGYGGGLFTSPPPEAHLVTGDPSLGVAKLDVRWPSGAAQTVSPVALDGVLTVTEPTK